MKKSYDNDENEIAHNDIRRLAALGEIAGALAHEMNASLATIFLTVDWIRELSNSEAALTASMGFKRNGEHTTEAVSILESSAHKLSKVVGTLRSFAQSSSSDFLEVIDLAHLIDEVLCLCAHRFKHAGIELCFEQPSYMVAAPCRKIELGHEILNLLNLASRSAIVGEGRCVRLSLSESGSVAEICIRCESLRTEAASDNGVICIQLPNAIVGDSAA